VAREELLGTAIGRPKQLHVFDESAARELAASGMSLRAIGVAMGGVPHQAIARTVKNGKT